jgi:transcriptional regulator with XRE-family HTH domain
MKKKFGDRLLEIRTAKGLTQADFAELVCIPFRTYQQLEYNQNGPKLDTFLTICEGLEMTPNQVLEIDPPPIDQNRIIKGIIWFLEAYLRASKSRQNQAMEILQGGQETQADSKAKA